MLLAGAPCPPVGLEEYRGCGARRGAEDQGVKVPWQLGRGPSAFIPLEQMVPPLTEIAPAFVTALGVEMLGGLSPISSPLHTRAQTNNPTCGLSCAGSDMEPPGHPLSPGAGRGDTGSGGRRCPYRAGRRMGSTNRILQEGAQSSRHQLLVEAFVSAGRVDNITMVMGLHPQYLSSFWKTQYLLLRMDGPLPYHKRHYIAIMAAARHQCSYLVGLHMGEFLQVGGNPAWLQGLHCAPQKLRNLNEINKLLAHRPWLITKEHIEALLKTGEHSWSLAELVQALVLLTHYHSLASFVFGCGINPEEEQDGGHGCRPPSPHSDSSSASDDSTGGSRGKDGLREVEALMERMKLLQESQLEEEGVTQEEMATRFELEKTESLLVAPSDLPDHSLQSNVLCFVEDPEFGYKDFTRRGEQAPPTFRAQDYTWEDHGYSLINRLYPDVGQLLDEKFQVVYNLTYNTIAMHCGVDTSMLRRAIWNYVHCVFGIRYDDYDYGEVNQLLERSLKVYIKTVACYPEKTTKRMYTQFWRHFKHSEKVHVNLLLLEARMQAALLYALRAVTRYMT